MFCQFSPFFIDFHDLRTFVAIYILSRFTHFFRNFFLAKIAFSATSHVFCMYARKWKWPFPHSRFEHFRKTKTSYIDQINPQLEGEMFSETNFLWCVSKNVMFHCGSFFKSGCTFQLHVKNATFLVKMLVMSSNIC